MYLLKVSHLSMEVSGRTLFTDVSLEIKENERIALIGENGIGKTTLIRGLLGLKPVSSGQVSFNIEKEQIGYMVQEAESNIELPLKQWVVYNHPIAQLKTELDKYTELLNESANSNITAKYNNTLQKFLDVEGYEWEFEVERLLKQIGLESNLWEVPFSNLSGGQKTRAKLVRMMLKQPKLIILDEPTNHLDIDTIQWLENWLNEFNGAVLFISHEREFIDNVATAVYELTVNGTKKYNGGYSSYKAQKDLELKTQLHLYEKQEQERKKLMETIQQYKQWYSKADSNASVRDPYAQKKAAKQATNFKVLEKKLERFEENRVEKPEENRTISARFTSSEFSGRNMITLSNVSKSYDERVIIKDVNFHLQQGDRLAIIGSNGSGKTTLLRLMAGLIEPTEGTVNHNPQLRVGQFFQEIEHLNEENKILDEILQIPNMSQSDARTILACFLFRRDDVYKRIGSLSMGEKCRVAFVKLYFSNANLLILDEPTNYFDIPSREIIEDALLQYPGTIVIVAHDPYLLRKIANQVLYINDGEVKLFHGSYEEWEQHKQLSPFHQQLKNEIEQLELTYLSLITEENEEETKEEEASRMKEIKMIKEKINELKNKMKK